ncbi:MAG: putative Glyoxylate/hydroxypyruvate reductase [Ramlibacter sp.]|nr:putative Glyoxylate/hydroxypyruvate reductase [Ramlibacter sp.]
MESDRARVEGDRGLSEPRLAAPLRILLSQQAAGRLAGDLAAVLAEQPYVLLAPDAAGVDADVAFVSRDVTGLSTKHELQPATRAFYAAMEGAPSLRWVHAHSAGADRPVYVRLRERGVQVTTSSGANAGVVAHSAVAGLLALARHLPQLWAAQGEARWAPLIATGLPRDLEGQHAVLLGWGPIGQRIGHLLQALGLRVTVVRQHDQPAGPGFAVVPAERLHEALPTADWLLLACPLTERTRGLIDAKMLALLPPAARLVNVARGEIIDEPALIAALQGGRLAGAFLDVFAHEPLPADSPLWGLPNVIATPHSAGFSDGNAVRVERMFLDNLRRWCGGEALHNLAG